jgi:hypothetical protein
MARRRALPATQIRSQRLSAKYEALHWIPQLTASDFEQTFDAV